VSYFFVYWGVADFKIFHYIAFTLPDYINTRDFVTSPTCGARWRVQHMNGVFGGDLVWITFFNLFMYLFVLAKCTV